MLQGTSQRCWSNPFLICWASPAPAFLHLLGNNKKPPNLCVPQAQTEQIPHPGWRHIPQNISVGSPLTSLSPTNPLSGNKTGPAQCCSALPLPHPKSWHCRNSSLPREPLESQSSPQNPSSGSVCSFFPVIHFTTPLGPDRDVAGAVSSAASI